ncbi:Protein kinase domain [Sesbania bispinosa]|nr:Protein kinase domain [Sesbania bispinosa]
MLCITSDPENALETWKSPSVHVCDWSGVRCNNASDRIIELDLSGRQNPTTTGNCIALEYLNLSGAIPESLQLSSSLKTLNFSFQTNSQGMSQTREHFHPDHRLFPGKQWYSMVIKSKVRKRFEIVSRGDLEDEEEETKQLKFGQVYKGVILDNTRVAVKVLDTETAGDESTSTNSNSASFSSTHGLLCGSIGYIAPEYGMGKHASTEGDVYSFGVILLEIVTGRRPTDVLIHEGSSLHEWVKRQYLQPHKLENIVEQALQRCSPSGMPSHHNKIWKDIILELIEMGILCTQQNPSTRPSMLDVAQEMGRLKDYLPILSAVKII